MRSARVPGTPFNLQSRLPGVRENWSHNTIAQNSIMAWRGNYKDMAQAREYNWYEVQRNTLLDFYINYKKNFRGHQVEP